MKYKDFYSDILLEVDDETVKWYSNYLKGMSYDSENSAREDLRKRASIINDRQPEFLKYSNNEVETLVFNMPLYKIGKKYKVGKRPKSTRLTINDFDVKWTTRAEISTSGLFAPMDIKSVEKKFINYKKINPTERADIQHVGEICKKLQDGHEIRSIVVDDVGNISDGHHRYAALVKLKITEIPCSVVNTYQ